eukprot:TRINITY_DN38220_c0_g1_i1.p1 TRINITY_DN38220_c0_g1~~TRINITY_DN38220_c0_g1_i1.p1  ORF type:complete len:304 (+),score=26.76 TRINITY_DN38220_c0_g1_i1:180-1091(+)
MGAVHGVSFKYLTLSVAAGFALQALLPLELEAAGVGSRTNIPKSMMTLLLIHVCFVNFLIFLLFHLRMGMQLLGKNPATGAVPLWSYVVFIGFHGPTWLYTWVQRRRDRSSGVPPASEVERGWFVGGRFAEELGWHWAGIVDLTCEFPEGCAASTDEYLLLPCWDGVPPEPEWLERAALFAVSASAHGDVLVHCAHGRGRSTTVMCACLVKAGLYSNWEAAFEGIRRRRRVVKLNRSMRAALTAWQAQYMCSTPVHAASIEPSDTIRMGDKCIEEETTWFSFSIIRNFWRKRKRSHVGPGKNK